MTINKYIEPKWVTALDNMLWEWDAVLSGSPDKGAMCALCMEAKADSAIDCPCNSDCPIALDTGELACLGTPYEEWLDHHYLYHDYRETAWKRPDEAVMVIECDECRKYAEEFKHYLTNLRNKVTILNEVFAEGLEEV